MFIRQATFAAALLVAAAGTPALAGDDMHKAHKGKYHDKVEVDLVKVLSLEGEKAEQVKQIEKDYKEQRKELKQKHMQAMQSLKESRKNDLQEVLSEDEMATLKAMWEAHGKHGDKMSYHEPE